MFLIKLKQYFTFKRIVSGTLLAALIILSISGPLSAQSVTQGYGTDQPLQRGMIIGTKKDEPTKVEPINIDELDRMMGVVVDANESPITISGEQEKVFVATIGRYDVLVSDQKGQIKPGDYITASSLNGIGMLATYEESDILGRAITGFDGSGGVFGTSTLTDTNSQTRSVNIGRISVDVGIAKNPVAKSSAATPEFLAKVGQAIAGKSLSAARIYISATVFLVGAFISGAILYAGIRSSMIAIGRNPLSKRSILKGLLQVVFTSLIVFIISIFAVYLLLKV